MKLRLVLTILLCSLSLPAIGQVQSSSEYWITQTPQNLPNHATVAVNDMGTVMVTWNTQPISNPTVNEIMVQTRIFAGGGPGTDNALTAGAGLAGFHYTPDVATDGEHFVVVWSTGVVGNSSVEFRVYGKLFNFDGSDASGIFEVTTFSSLKLTRPDVAMHRDNGGFTVAWSHVNADNTMNVYARHFDLNINASSEPLRVDVDLGVNSTFPSDGSSGWGLPDIEVRGPDTAVIVWEHVYAPAGSALWVGVLGALFNSVTGQHIAGPVIIDHPNGRGVFQRRPMVDMNEAGDILFAWFEHKPENFLDSNVAIKKYRQATASWSSLITPHDNLDDTQSFPVISLMADGAWITAWLERIDTDGDGFADISNAVTRLYDSSDTALTEALPVNDPPANATVPAIGLSSSSGLHNFSIVFMRSNPPIATDIYGRDYWLPIE